jgi:hypothetical protein
MLRVETEIGSISLPLLDVFTPQGEKLVLPSSIQPQIDGNELINPFGNTPQPSGNNRHGIGVLASQAWFTPVGSHLTESDDPLYSTFLGHSGSETGEAIAADSTGAVYIAGSTYSQLFPTITGSFDTTHNSPSIYTDAFVTKLSADGSQLVYSTFLGGGVSDDGEGIAVDSNGYAYIVGSTTSSDFPDWGNPYDPTYNGGSDVFVTKLDVDGSQPIYSTFLGSSGDDSGRDIAIDSSGNAYVTGLTLSSGFPTLNAYDGDYNGNGDVFVTKFNAGGALVYSTFLGDIGFDQGYGIAVDSTGNAYVTGSTGSDDFPHTTGVIQETKGVGTDAFVTKLNSGGNGLEYSTFVGGSVGSGPQQGNDIAYDIAVDQSGQAHITGRTHSTDFPTKNPFQPFGGGSMDAFVTKLLPDASDYGYSSHLGGGNGNFAEEGYGIAVDASGFAYIVGQTWESNFPTEGSPFQNSNAGNGDGFIAKVGVQGTLVYSGYIGGWSGDMARDVAVDLKRIGYLVGLTNSDDFPVTLDGLDQIHNGSSDVFITKLIFAPVVSDRGTFSNGIPYPAGGANIPCPSDCGLGTEQGTQKQDADPINTRTGALDYSIADLFVRTSAGPLTFARYYTSMGTDGRTTTTSAWCFPAIPEGKPARFSSRRAPPTSTNPLTTATAPIPLLPGIYLRW